MTTWQEIPFVSENHFFQMSDERRSPIFQRPDRISLPMISKAAV